MGALVSGGLLLLLACAAVNVAAGQPRAPSPALLAPLDPAALEPPREARDAEALVRISQPGLDRPGTYLEASLRVAGGGTAPRVLELRAWHEPLRSLARVLAPPEEAGSALLKLHPNLWAHRARDATTRRVERGALAEPWLGSDLCRDDWVSSVDPVEGYRHRLLGALPGEARSGPTLLVVESVPLAGQVPWARILRWIEAESGLLRRRDDYDASGRRRRVHQLDEVVEVQSRRVPQRWRVAATDAGGRQTVLTVREIRFDQTFDPTLFSLRSLIPEQTRSTASPAAR